MVRASIQTCLTPGFVGNVLLAGKPRGSNNTLVAAKASGIGSGGFNGDAR
jgi:hypothetical protein